MTLRPKRGAAATAPRTSTTPSQESSPRNTDTPNAGVPWVRLVAIGYMAAVLLVALVRAHTGAAHSLPSTNAEQRNGLQGRAQHLERVLHHARTAMPWCIKHRRLFQGHAGTRCYWPHYAAARKAGRELAKTRARIAEQQARSLWAVLWAKWAPIIACETGNTFDWQWGAPGHPADGYQGGPNFHPSTWDSYRGSYASEAYLASPLQQLIVAERVLSAQGWEAWPDCSARAGYR